MAYYSPAIEQLPDYAGRRYPSSGARLLHRANSSSCVRTCAAYQSIYRQVCECLRAYARASIPEVSELSPEARKERAREAGEGVGAVSGVQGGVLDMVSASDVSGSYTPARRSHAHTHTFPSNLRDPGRAEWEAIGGKQY